MRPTLLIAALLAACSEAGPVAPDVPLQGDTDVVQTPDEPHIPDLPGEDGLDLTPFSDDGDGWFVGTWRDLDHWDFWNDLTGLGAPYEATHRQWGFDTRQRFRVYVSDGEGPVGDAEVSLLRLDTTMFSGRTNAAGEINLFGGLFDGRGGPWDLTTLADRFAAQSFSVNPGGAHPLRVDLTRQTVPPPEGVDLLVAIDHRAVMADILPVLQQGVGDWIAEAALALDEPVRATVHLLDDRGVTPGAWDDLDGALDALHQTTASGAHPAALDDLFDQVGDTVWSSGASARVVVLFTASSSLQSEALDRLQEAVPRVTAAGVRVHIVQTDPSSDGAFLLRNLAIATDGSWHFLLQPGRNATTDLVGDFEVGPLHDLLERIVLDATATF